MLSKRCSYRKRDISKTVRRAACSSPRRHTALLGAAVLAVLATTFSATSVLAVTQSDEAVLATRSGSSTPVVFSIVDDPVVHRGCRWMLAHADFGLSRVEYAAFLVRGPDGKLALDEWPEKTSDEAAWRGAFPSGTVGIVHTHPNWKADPSVRDVLIARQSHVPVYVLTLTRITVTDGEAVRVLAEGRW